MYHLKTLVLGNYQTNCYILWAEGSNTCCIVDPGFEPEVVLDKLNDLGLTPDAIALTHGHFDHIGGVQDLVAATGCKVYLCPPDATTRFPLSAGPVYYTDALEEGMKFLAGGLEFTVLHTPGHTLGSVCFQTEDLLLSGDTLFAGTCGRTDLPGGSFSQIRQSLKRLASLEPDYWVLPGHGESTTLAEEKRYNPYMQ